MRNFFDKYRNENIKFVEYDFRIIDSARPYRKIQDDYHGNTKNEGSRYADDITYFFKTAEDFQRALLILNDISERFGLTINTKKTQTMIFNFFGEDKCYPQISAH